LKVQTVATPCLC